MDFDIAYSLDSLVHLTIGNKNVDQVVMDFWEVEKVMLQSHQYEHSKYS